MGEESANMDQAVVVIVTAIMLGLFILACIRTYLMKKSADTVSMDDGT